MIVLCLIYEMSWTIDTICVNDNDVAPHIAPYFWAPKGNPGGGFTNRWLNHHLGNFYLHVPLLRGIRQVGAWTYLWVS